MMTKLTQEFDELVESMDAPPPIAGGPSERAVSPEDWHPDLNPTQRLIFDDPTKFILGHGEKGCRTGGALIYTATGVKRLGDMRPAGSIAGEFTPIRERVVSFFSSGNALGVFEADGFWVEADKSAISIELANGSEMTGSPRHPIWCCCDGEFGYQSLLAIQHGLKHGKRYWTPLIGHPEWSTHTLVSVCGFEITENVAYAVGALVGDGSLNISTGDHRPVYFTNQDQECIDGVILGLNELDCRLVPLKKKNEFSVRGPYGRLAQIVRKLGIDKLSYEKRIPSQIIESPKPVVCAFLRGLFDTDGTVEKMGLVSLCTVSENLGKDVQDMLAVLGILCVRRPKKSASGNPTWTLSIIGSHAHQFGKLVGFNIKRKQARISRPKPSKLNPNGFNHNRYGYPDSVRELMKTVALASRTDIRKPRAGAVHRNREWHNKHRKLHSFGSVPSAEKLEQFCDLYQCQSQFADYALSSVWLELKSAKDTLAELFDLHVPITHSFLASGTINHNSGKTIAFAHKIVRHAYENDQALVIIITSTIRAGNEGIWHDLDTLVLPQWKAGIGLEFTQSKLDNLTKDRHRWVKNRFGRWSKIMLMSVLYGSMMEARIKGPQPSFVHIEEISNCDTKEYFTWPAAQIGRRPGISGPQQLTASCNPQGPSNWVYKLFWEECMDPVTTERKPSFAVYHVPITENEHRLPPGYVKGLMDIFDEVEVRRLIHGEWIDRPSGEGLFVDFFKVDIHVKGNRIAGRGIVPMSGGMSLISYDIGPMWPSITFEQLITLKGKPHWIIFDEIDIHGARTLYKALAKEVIGRVRYWNKLLGQPLHFIHITDDSAINQWRAGGETGSYDAWEFEKEYAANLIDMGGQDDAASLRQIRMIGCPKGAGSVEARVRMLQTALHLEQVSVSATCQNTIDMLCQLEAGDDGKPKRSTYIHKFDSVTYGMFKFAVSGRNSLPSAQVAPSLIHCGTG